MAEAQIIGYIVIGLTAIISLFLAVGKPLIENQKIITKLNITIESLIDKITQIEEKNHLSHKKIWEKANELDDAINNHELRLHDIERDLEEKNK